MIKNKKAFTPHYPVKEILDGKLFGKAIFECLQNNDPEGVIEVISGYLEVLNKSRSAKRVELPHSTLYDALKRKNPTIKTLAKLVHASTLDTRK